MQSGYIQQLFEYNYALHRKVWDCIAHLTPEQFVQEIDYSIGSVRNHMVHLASVDQRWLTGVQGEPITDHLNLAAYPTPEAARTIYDVVEQRALTYIQQADDQELNRVLKMTIRRGTIEHPVWQILVHIVNHGTDHRAQVLPILHRFGGPTLEQDFMIYLWSIQK
jgi:uncharacterized damage-inducible protein DinB